MNSENTVSLPEMEAYRVRSTKTIPTPALLFYEEPLKRNIEEMIRIASTATDDDGNEIECAGAERLRPHVKTHKCPQVVQLCREAGIEKFKCSTLAEAKMLADAGACDIVIAYQLTGPHIPAFKSLRRHYPDVSFMPIVDNFPSLQDLADPDAPACPVLLDVNVGMDRTGITGIKAAVRLYRHIAQTPGIEPGGIHAYDGQINESLTEARKAKADVVYRKIQELRSAIAAQGMEIPRIILGGTPTFPCHARRHGVELSPGTCVLHDWGYLSKYRDLSFQPAALILSRVVSTPKPGSMTIDCGSKAICSDPSGPRGVLLNVANADPLKQSEEHWSFGLGGKQALIPGDECYILPTHICTTVAKHSRAWVIDRTGNIRDTWPITAADRYLSLYDRLDWSH